ncbi:MAG: OmpH family outer membrane protein [Desulfoprunum sp.]|nr:OmpH family outer membrane protein [Desulfoprunum sp.]
MVLKRILLVSMFFMFTGFLTDGVKAAEMKIGVMNVQKIIILCDAGKAGKTRFEGKMKELQGKFKQEEETLTVLQKEIEKKSSAWSEETKAVKVRDFQKLKREFQAKTEDARYELKQLQDKELEPILKALEGVVLKYGKENGYTAILDSKNGVIYNDPAIDISDLIVKELNKSMTK